MKGALKILTAIALIIALAFVYITRPLPPFNLAKQPQAPDYTQERNWIALPFKEDVTDVYPQDETPVHDSLKQVDVFYIYPTMYEFGRNWNADVNSGFYNTLIEQLPVKHHASIFNRVGRVYVPRYRQICQSCFGDTTGGKEQAIELAYSDVKRAFEYFLSHYNQGRPIILAGHSQGTMHGRRLMKEFFDHPEMKSRLVCAYFAGNPIFREDYELLQPCPDSSATEYYVAWSSFKEGYANEDMERRLRGDVCINPVSWSADTARVLTNGSILYDIESGKRYTTEVRIHNNGLRVKSSHFLMNRENPMIMHTFDFNLFWHDVRKNATLRVEQYLKRREGVAPKAIH